ncbi:MAG: type IX secretion system membrane protein PorP/SprF [Flavobacteriales bacterium]
MRRWILTAWLAAIAMSTQAQQLSQYTQYVFNMFSVNPGVAGSKDCIDLRLGYRQQWTGFDGAPTTGWISLHGTIRQKGKPFQANKHGIGVFAESDNAGNWGYTRFLLAYAYHIQMSRDYFLSLGTFAGLEQVKFNVGDVIATDFNDPALAGKATVMLFPEITPGIWLYSKTMWAGLSLHQLVGNKYKDIGVDSHLSRHLMLTGGYKYRLAKKTALIPSALIKFAGGAPMAADLNCMVEYNRTLALGVGYRNGDALTILMKIGFMKFFQVGYSYDVTTSKLRVASSNTHEIVLAITPCARESVGRRAINCPAFD